MRGRSISPALAKLARNRHARPQATACHHFSGPLPTQNIQAAEASLDLTRALEHSQELPMALTRYELVRGEVTDACHQVRRIIEHRHHLLDQLTDLCHFADRQPGGPV